MTLKHLQWLKSTGKAFQTADGKTVEIFELDHTNDEKILSAWAKHFRNQYCPDNQIDLLREGTSKSRKEYLNEIKFPDRTSPPGPSIRSGDFAEILVADYLEYIHDYLVPRKKYANKAVRNESIKGSDIIGLKVINTDSPSKNDSLIIVEAKASLSIKCSDSRLQDAIVDSAKDFLRKAESLNYVKQQYLNEDNSVAVKLISRFQDPVKNPHKEIYGAVALFSDVCFDRELEKTSTTAHHPNRDSLRLVVIKGRELMTLVHELYRRAADEA